MSSADTYYNTSAEYAEVSYDLSSTGGAGDEKTIPPTDVDHNNPDGNVTYYNIDSELAEYSNDAPNTAMDSKEDDIASHDTEKHSNGSRAEDDVSDEESTVTHSEIIRKNTSKTKRKVPSLYDENMYSLAGSGDKESINGSQHKPEPSSPSERKDKPRKQTMNACLRCRLPIALILLFVVGVGVILYHYKMFPEIFPETPSESKYP